MAAAVSIQQLGRRLKDRCAVAPTVLTRHRHARADVRRGRSDPVHGRIRFRTDELVTARSHRGSHASHRGSHATGFHGASRSVLDVRVEARRSHAVSSRHVEGRRAAAIDGRRAVSARKDLGLRPDERLGVGRLQRRVRHRPRRGTGEEAQAPLAHSERRLPALRRRQGPGLFPAVQLRALSEPAESGRFLRRRLRQHAHRDAAPGHPAAEVLRAVLGVVPHAEDALLPLRLVVELIAGRSGAGRGRRQPDLDLQPVRERGCRHHVAAHRAQHRGSVPGTGSAWTTA